MKCVISVLGKDRSGVVAAIATTLADCGANIDDISQTILGEGRMFSMTMMVTLDSAVADFNTVQERLAKISDAFPCRSSSSARTSSKRCTRFRTPLRSRIRLARAGAELPLRMRVDGRLCRDGAAARNSCCAPS